MKKRYFYNIDFLRFIFCLSILVFHFPSHASKISTIFIPFTQLKINFSFGYICVEFFFIISGFLWSLSLDKQISLFEFAKKKIIRFFPLMLFTVICFLIISLFNLTAFDGMSNILALSFLSGLGFKHTAFYNSLGNIHSCWYISVLFWVLLFYQYLHNNYQKKNFNLFICIVIIIGYTILTDTNNGSLNVFTIRIHGILNSGLLRGLCAIGIGYLIGEAYKTCSPKLENIKLKLIPNILLTTINFLALSFVLSNLFHAWTLINNDIFFLFCFAIIMLCFVFNKDYISHFFNNKYFAFMGKYSLSIYILHNLIMDIFKHKIFTEENLTIIKAHPYSYFYSGIVLCVIAGVIVYYLVEKPAAKYLTKYLKKD